MGFGCPDGAGVGGIQGREQLQLQPRLGLRGGRESGSLRRRQGVRVAKRARRCPTNQGVRQVLRRSGDRRRIVTAAGSARLVAVSLVMVGGMLAGGCADRDAPEPENPATWGALLD